MKDFMKDIQKDLQYIGSVNYMHGYPKTGVHLTIRLEKLPLCIEKGRDQYYKLGTAIRSRKDLWYCSRTGIDQSLIITKGFKSYREAIKHVLADYKVEIEDVICNIDRLQFEMYYKKR